ncbi:GNAT family N-acetyltransferase [Clostridium sp. FP2]|uniref:GNAT family N-acetyltransferase n=1 Tax=Clostridium sp. FP2 TaxID=2724481 RepID=UPI0013E96B52|nr:GNAT family N-acetyltransferase [Clostridium sp. FP2]MBZ9623740.1 GNAT family N-acetyltransferase [Clostridium sp. FP2]
MVTEMIKGLINFGYRNGGRKITAEVAQENAGSNAVLKKLGFYAEKEGPLKSVELILYMTSIPIDLT